MGETVSGFSMKSVIGQVEKEKGPEGLKELEEKYGNSIEFYSFRRYAFEDKDKLTDAACEVLYGDKTHESYYKLGKVAFKYYTGTTAGKVIMSFFAKDIKSAMLGMPRALSSMQKQEDFKMEVEDLGPKKIKFIMTNSPYKAPYLAGLMAASAEHFGVKPVVTWKKISSNSCELYAEWE